MKLSLVFLALLAYKLIYLLAISAAISMWPEKVHQNIFHSANQVSTPDGYLTFDCHFASWDAEHYLFIAAHGYETGDGRCAFYPLFPLAIRYCSITTGGSQLLAGMILANLFSLVGWLIFFTMVHRRFGDSTARIALILLVAFPGSLFFQFVYTESLFFLLLMLLLLGLQEDRCWLSLASAFLLPLARAVGLFCVFPLLWDLMTNSPLAWWLKLKTKIPCDKMNVGAAETAWAEEGTVPSRQLRRRGGWLLLAPLLGWVVYLMLMKESTGNAFEGFEAQKQFGMQSIGNIFKLSQFLFKLVTPSTFYAVRGSIVDRCSFILLICSLPVIWRLDKSWFLWSVFLGVVPAMSGMFVSYTRFASVVFPLFVAMAVFLNKPGLLFRCFRVITVATFAIVQIILLWRFVNFRWAG
jgi:hypothetical protein